MPNRAKGIRAGEAFVEMFADDRNVAIGLDKLKNKFQRFGQNIRAIGLGFGLIGASITGPLFATIPAAARVENSFTRLRLLFGQTAGEAENFVQKLGFATNRTGLFVRESLVSFEAFFKGLQFGEEQAARFSKALTTLQLDFAAATGQTAAESMRRFIAALAGSPEVLDQFGIDLKELSLNAVLAANGIESVRKATEQQKTLARILLIFDRLGKQGAIDAASKTMTNFATILDQLKGSSIEAAAAIGNELKPVFITISGAVNVARSLFVQYVSESGAVVRRTLLIGASFTALGGALIGLGIAFKVFGVALGAFSTFFGLPAIFLSFASSVIAAISPLAAILGPIASFALAVGVLTAAFLNWSVVSQTATRLASAALSGLSGIFRRISQEVIIRWGIASSFFLQTLQFMVAAVRRGELEKASKLMMASIRIAWTASTLVLSRLWNEFLDNMLSSVRGISDSVRTVFENMVNSIAKSLAKFSLTISFVFNDLRTDIAVFVAGILNELERLTSFRIPLTRKQAVENREAREKKFADRIAAAEKRGLDKEDALVRELREIENLDLFSGTREARDEARDRADQGRSNRQQTLENELTDLRDQQAAEVQKIRKDISALPPPKPFDVQSIIDEASRVLQESAAGLAGSALGVQSGIGDSVLRGLTGQKVVQKQIAANTESTAKATSKIAGELEKLISPAFGQ